MLDIPAVFAGLLPVTLIGLVLAGLVFRMVSSGRCGGGACRAEPFHPAGVGVRPTAAGTLLMPKLRLYTSPATFPNPQRVRLLMHEKGIAGEIEEVMT